MSHVATQGGALGQESPALSGFWGEHFPVSSLVSWEMHPFPHHISDDCDEQLTFLNREGSVAISVSGWFEKFLKLI